MKKILIVILITLSASILSAQTTYTEQQILNRVFIPADGVLKADTAYSGQNVLNMVFNPASNGLKVNVSTTSASFVLKAGDNMSGQLTTSSTITVQGSAFSVGGSTLVVTNGNVGIGTQTPADKLDISSGTIRLAGTGTPPKGQALCLGTNGKLGVCTVIVLASGLCTCTEP